MSALIRTLTYVLLALPLLLFVAGKLGQNALSLTGLFLVAVYAWVWLRFRPGRFVVHPQILEVIWPMKRRQLARASITGVQLIGRHELREKIGLAMRIGAGGLWGGFGWLWTTRQGIIQMYISCTDNLVWIESVDERPWLISPEEPEAFIEALSS
jgi:hypothetical protein